MSKLHQLHLSQHLIERGGAMGVRHERANGERARKKARRRTVESTSELQVSRLLTRSLRRWRTRRCRRVPIIVGINRIIARGHVSVEWRRSLDVTSAPVRRIGTVTETFLSKGDTCLTRARRGRDARDAAPDADRRRLAPETGQPHSLKDGKLLPMRYISSSSASMHLRCRLMTSRKKA